VGGDQLVKEPADGDGQVELRGVGLAFGRRAVFRDLSCSFPRGRLSVIMGGSGMGKSTILRMIGGLQAPDVGSIVVGGDEVVGLGERGLTRMRRRLGMLFQNGALLDSMTIFENIALPMQEHSDFGSSEIADHVHERLTAVGLSDVDDLLPGELSGGMLRRAAFARAIVMAPEILLCDEPFSGLDPPNVSRIEALLVHLNKDLGLTVIVTSHHMATSLRMAEQLLLLRDGGCISGSPAELAASRESAITEFIGEDGAEFLARHIKRVAPESRS
jgi:phospholipid/cholesterol/gamma-HCH transport system ATP-binding protein